MNASRGAWQHRMVGSNGVALHVVQAGTDEAPPVLLLHGFPEFWYGWKNQIEPLTRAGYRVLAIDQRGYNLSDKPRAVSDYKVERLTSDVVGLIDAIEADRVFLIGHDWGGHVAWSAAERYPERIRKLVILNVAHPRVMTRNILLNPRQTLKSWYVLALQVPWIPEWLLSRDEFAILRKFIHWDGTDGPMSAEDERLYIEAWSRKAAFTSMINWYRASFRSIPRCHGPRITVPTLLIWGEKDRFLDRSLAQQSIALCDSGRVAYFAQASHWVHHEEPRGVSDLIERFFGDVT